MQKLSLIILFLLTFSPIFSQEGIKIKYNFGFGSYSMSDVKSVQEQIFYGFRSEGIGVRITEEFPSYFNHQVSLEKRISSKIALGSFISYQSTGGRIHLKDYSGEITSDQIVSNLAIGAILDIYLREYKYFNLILSIQPSLQMSTLKLDEKITVYDNSYQNELKLKSLGFGFEPMIGLEYKFNRLIFRGDAGLGFNFSGAFHLEGEPDAKLKIYTNEIQPDWFGYRARFSIGILI